ncbi:MAG: type II toxin-antitoxin system HicA family toxin [Microcystis novacekii Mn_MB_F_20050700_S1]|nr:MAG: type II toxin-antitoxin system HicA family toxin [Microcystis novacekii Mn_MB_F_20050700_S1]
MTCQPRVSESRFGQGFPKVPVGFDCPYAGGKHPQMRRNNLTIIIPNPHQGEIGVGLLKRILNQAGITREEWLGE